MKTLTALALILTATTAQATTHMDAAVWAAQNGYRLIPEAEIHELTYDLPNNGYPVKWMEIEARFMVQWPEFDPALADSLGFAGGIELWSSLGSPTFFVRSVAADSVTVGPWTYKRMGKK